MQLESAPGRRVVVEADTGAFLWPQGFDPLNVLRVEGGVLHARFLKVGNESGRAEVMSMSALIEEVGPHPLFSGIRRLVLTGFESEPAVEDVVGTVDVSSPGFRAGFVGAGVGRQDTRIVILLAPPARSGDYG